MCELCDKREAERKLWIEDTCLRVCDECFDWVMRDELGAGIDN